MDARSLRLALTLGIALLATQHVGGAEYRTPNFIAKAPTEEFAKQVAFTAEQWRSRLAKEWLGRELPRWYKPCPIEVKVGSMLGAGGATTFNFDRGQVFGWRMNVQGTAERILDSVIPHEVSHTIFASHFRRPLPRWADEGAATLAEHESEQRRQDLHLKQVWKRDRIPLKSLLSMTEYPTDMRDVMTLYAQGYSLADYLVQKEGRTVYLDFLDEAESIGWEAALKKHYGMEGIDALEETWGGWVLAGSPDLPKATLLADAGDVSSAGGETGDVEQKGEREVIRAQSDDSAAAEWSSPAPVPPVKTAMIDQEPIGGFLPPRSREPVSAATADPERVGGDREPRPAPLGPLHRTAGRSDSGATETASRRSAGTGRALPRTSRIEAPSHRGGFDFFQSASDETTGASARVLGRGDFPGAR